jgi:hypothetical protein
MHRSAGLPVQPAEACGGSQRAACLHQSRIQGDSLIHPDVEIIAKDESGPDAVDGSSTRHMNAADVGANKAAKANVFVSLLLQCMSPLMAQSRRAGQRVQRQLSGVKQPRFWLGHVAAYDP